MLKQISLIQCYIHHKKGVEVNIEPPTNLRQIALLNKAYNVAYDYFKK